ncbi:MAG: DUF1080 domain-containing protein [Gemmatimonadetes bacterium]|nr:DUF1080 domain-containing protein [Gemmatimonadota bacterium]
MSQRTRRISRVVLSAAVAASLTLGGTGALAQQGQAGQRPGGQGGPGQGGGGTRAQTLPVVPGDTTGFTRIFMPGSLAGWDGDSRFWSAKGDTIIAESTPTNMLTENTFLIYRGDQNLRDFELKVEYRFPELNGNGGVQIRSSVRPGAAHQWRVTGMQVDLDATNNYSGMLYGEQAGGFIAPRGEVTRIAAGQTLPQSIASLGTATELRGLMNMRGWNQLHIIAKGNTIMTVLNGRVTSVLIDEAPTALVPDPSQARLERGLVALQMHTGVPFRIMYRNVFLKKLN